MTVKPGHADELRIARVHPGDACAMTDLSWVVYIVENEHGALYTGITNSITRRLQEHASKARGASFFRFARPKRLVYAEVALNRSAASRREVEIKRLRRSAKLALIAAQKAAAP
jgi:putative endonuclease